VVLDQLIALDRASEYSPSLGTEMRELITYSKAVATRYRNMESMRSNVSVRSGSPLSVRSDRNDEPPIIDGENNCALNSSHAYTRDSSPEF